MKCSVSRELGENSNMTTMYQFENASVALERQIENREKLDKLDVQSINEQSLKDISDTILKDSEMFEDNQVVVIFEDSYSKYENYEVILEESDNIIMKLFKLIKSLIKKLFGYSDDSGSGGGVSVDPKKIKKAVKKSEYESNEINEKITEIIEETPNVDNNTAEVKAILESVSVDHDGLLNAFMSEDETLDSFIKEISNNNSYIETNKVIQTGLALRLLDDDDIPKDLQDFDTIEINSVLTPTSSISLTFRKISKSYSDTYTGVLTEEEFGESKYGPKKTTLEDLERLRKAFNRSKMFRQLGSELIQAQLDGMDIKFGTLSKVQRDMTTIKMNAIRVNLKVLNNINKYRSASLIKFLGIITKIEERIQVEFEKEMGLKYG